MATCRIVNEPVIPKQPDKVVLEMTGDEAMKHLAFLKVAYWENSSVEGPMIGKVLEEAMRGYTNPYKARFSREWGGRAVILVEKNS